MIELSDKTEVKSIFLASGTEVHWMCIVHRQPGGMWRIAYRFRYETTGESSWYGFEFRGPDDEDINPKMDAIREWVYGACLGIGASPIELTIEGNGIDAVDAMLANDVAYVAQELPPQSEAN